MDLTYAFIGSAHQTLPTPTTFAGPGFLSAAAANVAGTTRSVQQQQQRRQRTRAAASATFPSSPRRAAWALNMATESDSPNEMPEVTKKLLAQAAKARAEAMELEIAYRKEQGLEDLVPVVTKANTAAENVARNPSNPELQAKAANAISGKWTPESRDALVAQLENLPSDSKGVIGKMGDLKGDGLAPRWASFDFGSQYPVSQRRLKMQTGLDGKSLAADGGDMDDLKYALGAVCLFSFIAAVGFGSAIGGNVGASFTYFFALLPIVFLAIGSTAPGIITAVINSVKRKSQDDYEERRVRHEAAHFLSGYLCGLPIKSYKAEGGTTLVEFYDSMEGDVAGRALKFTAEEVDKVSIVAMSGAVGEAQAFGSATGGASDIDNLGQIMNQTNPPMDGKDQQSQARWATLMAYNLLKSHDPELNSVMKAFREGKPVSECVAALEGARSS